MQSGKYGESLELTSVALKVEERELGSRSERLVEFYGLMAEIYDEVQVNFTESKRLIMIRSRMS